MAIVAEISNTTLGTVTGVVEIVKSAPRVVTGVSGAVKDMRPLSVTDNARYEESASPAAAHEMPTIAEDPAPTILPPPSDPSLQRASEVRALVSGLLKCISDRNLDDLSADEADGALQKTLS